MPKIHLQNLMGTARRCMELAGARGNLMAQKGSCVHCVVLHGRLMQVASSVNPLFAVETLYANTSPLLPFTASYISPELAP